MALHVADTASIRPLTGTGMSPLPALDVHAHADAGALFLDADLGAIAFQQRVFEEAQNERHPLLERVKFLAILGTNLIALSRRARLAGAVRQLRHDAGVYAARVLSPALAAHDIHLPPLDATPAANGLAPLWRIAQINRPDLHDPPMHPRDIVGPQDDVFAAIRAGDLLLHHPYDSFAPIVALIRQAAADPAVTTIAITLYRTDRDSPIGQALLDARRRGKQVQAVVELRARHDEENNARWAAALRQAGAHVTYGVVGLKVHAKLALIERREGTVTRRYAHVSSGNYHTQTSQTYTDVALLTCDDAVTADASDLFAFLGGRRDALVFRRLVVAPFSLRRRLSNLIAREIECARSGSRGHILVKVNALTDRDVIRQLYRASQAGVQIDLIVRGICRLRPGVPGLSERIRVTSIVGRFLEHSRVWYFRNGGRDDIHIGSADLRPRNLDRRVEVMAPIDDAALAQRIRRGILDTYLADTADARGLRADGQYVRLHPRAGDAPMSCQRALLQPSSAEDRA
jgi:polyphosphate kinase